MHKVKVKVTRPAPPDDGKLCPPGHVKEQVTFVEVLVDCDCDKEACCEAEIQCKKEFSSECCVEVESVEQVEKVKPGFEHLNIEEQKKIDTTQKKVRSKPITTGKKTND